MIPIARSPEEVRALLGALEGEHRPTKKAYYISAIFAFFSGVVGPIVLLWALWSGDPYEERFWESLSSLIIGPLLAFEIVRSVMGVYVIDESQVSCISAIRIGSWTLFRAEIDQIDANVTATGIALWLRSSTQGVKVLPLRKRHRELLLRMFPELRKAKLRASAQEREKQRKGRLYVALLALFFVLLVVMIFTMLWLR